MVELLERKQIFDELFQVITEGGEFKFTKENIFYQYHAFLMLCKEISPIIVNFYSVKHTYYYDDNVNFSCVRDKEFYITQFHIYEDEKNLNQEYLDELVIEF